MSKQLDQERLVSSILETYVQTPDYSEKRAEIESHTFVTMKLPGDRVPHWYKVLFTTSDTAVVQEVLMTWDQTRFVVTPIPLSEWDTKFVEWIDEDHQRFWEVDESWQQGARQYGANV